MTIILVSCDCRIISGLEEQDQFPISTIALKARKKATFSETEWLEKDFVSVVKAIIFFFTILSLNHTIIVDDCSLAMTHLEEAQNSLRLELEMLVLLHCVTFFLRIDQVTLFTILIFLVL